MIECNFYDNFKLCEKYCNHFKERTLYLDYPKKLKLLLKKRDIKLKEVIESTKELEQCQIRIDNMIDELRIKKQNDVKT